MGVSSHDRPAAVTGDGSRNLRTTD